LIGRRGVFQLQSPDRGITVCRSMDEELIKRLAAQLKNGFQGSEAADTVNFDRPPPSIQVLQEASDATKPESYVSC